MHKNIKRYWFETESTIVRKNGKSSWDIPRHVLVVETDLEMRPDAEGYDTAELSDVADAAVVLAQDAASAIRIVPREKSKG